MVVVHRGAFTFMGVTLSPAHGQRLWCSREGYLRQAALVEEGIALVHGKARWAWWCAGCGMLDGSLALTLGLIHNAQGEFFDTDSGRIDWGYCIMVFGTWFAAAAVVMAFLLLLWLRLRRMFPPGSR
jgi:hypothetical protein